MSLYIYIYTFAFESNYGFWNPKIHKICEGPVYHPFCFETDEILFAYERVGQTLLKKLVNKWFGQSRKI